MNRLPAFTADEANDASGCERRERTPPEKVLGKTESGNCGMNFGHCALSHLPGGDGGTLELWQDIGLHPYHRPRPTQIATDAPRVARKPAAPPAGSVL